MSHDKIKLPRSSYEELVKIIKSYGGLNKPSSLNDVAQGSGLSKTTISANNAFIANIEVIEGGIKKKITPKGLQLARALEHEIEADIKKSWSAIITENDFLTKMIQAVSIRKGMEISQLENHIAYSAGEPKSGYVMTGAKAVVDILLASDLLIIEGDKIVANKNNGSQKDSSLGTKQSTKTLEPDDQIKAQKYEKTIYSKSGLSINIDLRINAKPDELDGLGEKIKEIIKSIENSDEQ